MRISQVVPANTVAVGDEIFARERIWAVTDADTAGGITTFALEDESSATIDEDALVVVNKAG